MTSLSQTFWCVVVCLWFFCGCARDPYVVRWDATAAQAERLYLNGEYGEAREAFELLRQKARVDRDRYYATLRTGDCFLGLKDFRRARDAYYESTHFAEDRGEVAKAMFRVARSIYISDPSQGLRALLRVMEKYPDTFWAARSLDYITAHQELQAGGDAWLIAFYREELAVVSGTAVEGHLRVRLAENLEKGGGESRLREALVQYDAILGLEQAKALWDDALYAKSVIFGRLGMLEEELEVHRHILQSRKEASLFGNYETTFYHRCQWRIAELLLGPLDRRREGISALRTFVSEFAYSRRYDDALYRLAVVLFEDGEDAQAVLTLDRLVKERPESRYVRRVESLKQTGRDPGPDAPWAPRPGGGGRL